MPALEVNAVLEFQYVSDVLHLEVHGAWRHEFWCSPLTVAKLRLNDFLGVFKRREIGEDSSEV